MFGLDLLLLQHLASNFCFGDRIWLILKVCEGVTVSLSGWSFVHVYILWTHTRLYSQGYVLYAIQVYVYKTMRMMPITTHKMSLSIFLSQLVCVHMLLATECPLMSQNYLRSCSGHQKPVLYNGKNTCFDAHHSPSVCPWMSDSTSLTPFLPRESGGNTT